VDLFVRSSGETSDIVTKQMYEFKDKGDRSMTLKPEGTAPVIRALIEHSLCPPPSVCRLSYITPVYRYERPQKGRLRESHQVGLELIGSSSPAADAEVIEITVRFYERIGIDEVEVLLNSLGREECRGKFRQAILEHMAGYLKDQPEEMRARAEKNPLRLLDSKDPAVQEALRGLPPITDFLEDDSKSRFDELQRLLILAGVKFRISPDIVRGLDYYTETVFEVQSTKLGAQSALCGGGRYDTLVKDLGGSDLPAVGVAMGIERALIVLQEIGGGPQPKRPDAFIIQATPAARDACLSLAKQMRHAGLTTLLDYEGRSMKSQLKQADRENARVAVILGDDEIAKGVGTVRNLATSEQKEVPLVGIVDVVRSMQ
ncbi:MAG: histidyl-tRNA synthetase, partial [Fimbriimonadaceae bacterium]|nr:histidyl-tRNA synthetase [Fimbriimonadaceae bacterium]